MIVGGSSYDGPCVYKGGYEGKGVWDKPHIQRPFGESDLALPYWAQVFHDEPNLVIESIDSDVMALMLGLISRSKFKFRKVTWATKRMKEGTGGAKAKWTDVSVDLIMLSEALLYKEMQIHHPLTPPGQVHLRYVHFLYICIACGTDFFKKNQLWKVKGAKDVIHAVTSNKELQASILKHPVMHEALGPEVLPLHVLDSRHVIPGIPTVLSTLRNVLFEQLGTLMPSGVCAIMANYAVPAIANILPPLQQMVPGVSEETQAAFAWNLHYWLLDWNSCYVANPVKRFHMRNKREGDDGIDDRANKRAKI